MSDQPLNLDGWDCPENREWKRWRTFAGDEARITHVRDLAFNSHPITFEARDTSGYIRTFTCTKFGHVSTGGGSRYDLLPATPPQPQGDAPTPEAIYGKSWDELDAELKPKGYRTLRRIVQACEYGGLVLMSINGLIGTGRVLAIARGLYLAAVEPLPKPAMERVTFEVPAGAELVCCLKKDYPQVGESLRRIEPIERKPVIEPRKG